MTNPTEPGAEPDDTSTPRRRPRPKRGAFPTPKSEIERAKQYVPEAGELDDRCDATPDPATDVDQET